MYSFKNYICRPSERNVIYIPKITSSHATLMTPKKRGFLQSDWMSVLFRSKQKDPQSAEKPRLNIYCFNFSAYISFFVKGLIETNVNVSNELNFSDVYPSVNYTGSPAKGPPFEIHSLSTQCSLHSIHLRKKKTIHSLNERDIIYIEKISYFSLVSFTIYDFSLEPTEAVLDNFELIVSDMVRNIAF